MSYFSPDVSSVLHSAKKLTIPSEISSIFENTAVKKTLTIVRWISFFIYPYLLTILANCLSSNDINTISFLIENRTGAFYFGLFIFYSTLFCVLNTMAGW